jgi:hypothetical protein
MDAQRKAGRPIYTGRPKHRLVDQRMGGGYFIDYARDRLANLARTAVSFGPLVLGDAQQ